MLSQKIFLPASPGIENGKGDWKQRHARFSSSFLGLNSVKIGEAFDTFYNLQDAFKNHISFKGSQQNNKELFRGFSGI